VIVPVNHAEGMSVVSTCTHGGALVHIIYCDVLVHVSSDGP
jgi:hypothetical protein